MRILHRLSNAKDGTVAVEAALVLSLFLAPTLVCLWDVGQIYQGRAIADESLQDAATYVMNTGTNATGSGVTAAAQASGGGSISASTSTVCYCVTTSGTTPTMPSSVSCSGSCSGSTVLQKFMSIGTTESVTIPFPVSWLNITSPYTVTATVNVRTG
jgi:hypothetical protein